MKIRTIALAGAAALAMSGPAFASEPGWYLGLGIGYDNLMPVHVGLQPFAVGDNPDYNFHYNDNAIYAGMVGYKFDDSGWRIELELSGATHTGTVGVPRKDGTDPGGLLRGGTTTLSVLGNLLYDYNLGDGWAVSLGGGLGVANVNHYDYCGAKIAADKCVQGAHTEFQWQGIAGISYALSDDLDLFADYRYRTAEVDQDYMEPSAGKGAMSHVFQQHENIGMLGIRWYMGEAPPPPPPPAPPPPPPPPPPPVKTFIVFFDFDKSNLTAEAQSVVTEAVKTAKANGFVKVMVTGHTDTVGSDNYNQALSVRRAESVKDEMVRQGMDGGSISIEGKSFHDPLVPTGPGVREPQNRRAVIDLGG
jgi:outer membrane protein OmpA-like peptidoglycan-associated protein